MVYTYNRINLFLPTYRRVTNGKLKRFLVSAIGKVNCKDNICITFLIDNDDKESKDYLENTELPIKCQILTRKASAPHLGKMYNQLYEETMFKEEGTIISMVGDDMEFLTSGYDLAILNELNKCNGLGIVYCNDDYIQKHKLCVNLFTTRKFVELTKKPFMCNAFPAYFIDTVWTRVGQKTKTLHYLPNVKIKHHHYTKNPRNQDITSRRLQSVKPGFRKGYSIVDKYVKEIVKNLRTVL